MKHFDVISFIQNKQKGRAHQDQDFTDFVTAVTSEAIPNYQVSAWLMAAYLKGLSPKETFAFCRAIANSGEQNPRGNKLWVDKHSTGGVGDKTSLVLGPLLASLGAKVPMIAGRGLGHTGGTIDKMESIPGFKTELTLRQLKEQTESLGFCLSSQGKHTAPADRIFYHLRDVTATVDNISLITASILSKKIISGASSFVFDIKTGSGAFCQTLEKARELSLSMKEVCQELQFPCTFLLTNMNRPLGHAVGHFLEVIESVHWLQNKNTAQDFHLLNCELAAHMMLQSGLANNREEALLIIQKERQSLKALTLFYEVVKRQGGSVEFIQQHMNFEFPETSTMTLKANISGVFSSFSALHLGLALKKLGGGRYRTTDTINPWVGFWLNANPGDQIKIGDDLATIYFQKNQKNFVNDEIIPYLQQFAYQMTPSDEYKNYVTEPLVYEII